MASEVMARTTAGWSPGRAAAPRARSAAATAPSRSPSCRRAMASAAQAPARSSSLSAGDRCTRSSSRSVSRSRPWVASVRASRSRAGASTDGSGSRSSRERQAASASGSLPDHMRAPARSTSSRSRPGSAGSASPTARSSRSAATAGDRGAASLAALVSQATASASPVPAPRARCSATCRAAAPDAASRWPASRCSPTRTLAGKILVEGLAEQVVAEPEPLAVVLQDSGPDRLGQHRGQLQGRAAGGRRQLGQREARPQDGGGPHRLEGVLGQEAEPAQDGEPQGRWQGHLGHLGPPVGDLDRSLLDERAHQLGDEQRVAARPRHPGQQTLARLGGDDLFHQLGHGLVAERAKWQPSRAARVQGLERPRQLRGTREQPQAADQRHRHVAQAAAQRAQGQEAGRVGPLQVIQGDHQRALEGQRLDQVTEGVDGLELQARVAAHRDRAPVAEVGGQQLGDGPPTRVRGRAGARERVGQDPERPGPLQLLGSPAHDLEPAGPGVVQGLGKQPGLADAGLPLDEHDRRVAQGHLIERVAERLELHLAPAKARARRQRGHRPMLPP